jgi:hypothetical protein
MNNLKSQLTKGLIMTLSKTLPALAFAFAMIGGAVMLAPSSAKAANSGFISIGALKHNNIPCSERGGTAKNCRPGAQANPHTRGCSKITMCRG